MRLTIEISYAVTELLDGESLRANLRRGPLAWRKAVEIGMALAEGLAAAHAKGVTHRDLKPENIFLTADRPAPPAARADGAIKFMHYAGAEPRHAHWTL